MTDRTLTISNVLTVSRILLTPVFLALIFAEPWYCKPLALLVFSLASLTDFLDGLLARRRGTVTSVGRFLDPLADKILVTSALIAFVVLGVVEAWLVGILLVRDLAITLLRMYANRAGNPVVTSRMAKWKTALQLFLIFGILAFINIRVYNVQSTSEPVLPLDAGSHLIVNGLVAGVTLLAVISGVRYLLERSRSRG
jgi:CDP-diacylglycerol--glycerol-3-phosphate 3-phosphatidyltransferase